MKTLELTKIGVDSWSRPVYVDNNGKLWKDVNLGKGNLRLSSAYLNDFEGEPDIPIRQDYVIIN